MGVSNNGNASLVVTANSAGGTQLFGVGPVNATAFSAPMAQGLLSLIVLSPDTTAQTWTFYDGNSTGGTVRLKFVTPASATIEVVPLRVDIQFTSGCFFTLTGGTTVVATLEWL